MRSGENKIQVNPFEFYALIYSFRKFIYILLLGCIGCFLCIRLLPLSLYHNLISRQIAYAILGKNTEEQSKVLNHLNIFMNLFPNYKFCRMEDQWARESLALQDYQGIIQKLNKDGDTKTCNNKSLRDYWLAQAYYGSGSIRLALIPWKSIRAIVPLRELGDQLAQQKKWDDAALVYSALLDLVPNDCIYHLHYGNALWQKNHNSEEAVTQYKSVMNICPDNLESYIRYSRILIDNRDFDEAEIYALKAQSIDSSSELPLNVRALIYLRSGFPENAIPLLEEALNKNYGSAEAHALLGSAYLSLSNPNEAISEFQIAINIGPVQAWQYEAMGMAYEKIGDISNAIQAYLKVIELSPDRSDIQIHISTLRENK